MPEGNDRAPWETAVSGTETRADNESLANRTLPKVPPPPSDILLRTMASDLKSMRETGGGHPKPMTISVNIPANFETASGSPKVGGPINASRPPNRSITYLVAGIIFVIIATVVAVLWLRK